MAYKMTSEQADEFADLIAARERVSPELEDLFDSSSDEYSMWYGNLCNMFSVAAAAVVGLDATLDGYEWKTRPTRESLEIDDYNAVMVLAWIEEVGTYTATSVIANWWEAANAVDEFGRECGFDC